MLGFGKENNFMNDSWAIGLNDSVEWTEERLTGRRAGFGSEIMQSESADSGAAMGRERATEVGEGCQ